MFFRTITLFIAIWITVFNLNAQISVEGYTFEEKNRGYLYLVKVEFINQSSGDTEALVYTNKEGYFKVNVKANEKYWVRFEKDQFEPLEMVITPKSGNDNFLKARMTREDGYVFDVTLAPKRVRDDLPVDAIKGARIEVYNNTTDKQELDLRKHPHPNFQFHFKKGNHYTIMIRKEGYLTKRIEAYVNVKDCILCFDGLGTVEPGVSDNLHEGHEMGTFLANIEMEEVKVGSRFVLDNIYYDFDKWYIRDDAAEELDNLIVVLQDNPKLEIELGSHTDSRGNDKYNQELSEKRAKAAVEYLTTYGNIDDDRMTYKGYGESELTNRCRNGVDCSEEEHQLNRRTELKITGIREEDILARKTLAQIIREEQFMKAAMAGGQEFKVSEESEIPEDLQQYIERQRALKKANLVNQEEGWTVENFPSDYTGYSLFLTNNAKLLNQITSDVVIDNTIYKYVEKGHSFYLTGKFKKFSDANDQYKSLSEELGQMHIVHFENGKLTK